VFFPQDIYNINTAAKQLQLYSLSATDTVFRDLEVYRILYQINPDPDRKTRYLFFAFPEALELAKTNQDIVLADCTYNTIKYSLLLLYLVGKLFTG
jgi:hypothetical protein